MNFDNKLLICIICICIVLYIYITSCYINFLFNTILGRLLLFLFIIFIINVNNIIGFLLSVFILLVYNDYFHKTYELEEFTNNKDKDSDMLNYLKLINKKINLDKYFVPKDSNAEIIFIQRNKGEPSIYNSMSEILNLFY